MAKAYDVSHRDNRGTEDVPYGFVYFADGNRVGYSGKDSGLLTFDTNWGPVSSRHHSAARKYLKAA